MRLSQLKTVMPTKSNKLEFTNDEEGKENQEKMLNFIKENNLVFNSGGYPGVGKSKMFELAFKDEKDLTLWLVPTNNLGKKYKKGGFLVKTVHSFLCLNKEGIRRDMTGDEAVMYSKITRIIIDEIFCLTIDFIQKLEYWRRTHPEIKFYSTGDNIQLMPIIPHLTDEEIEAEVAYLHKNIHKMFPNNIHQEEIKRCRLKDGSIDHKAVNRIKQLKSEIFDLKYEFNEDRIRFIVRDFKKIKFKNIRSKRNICYLNNTARRTNTRLMSLFGGIKEGETILLCKKRLDLKKEDYTCYVNYEYLVKKISPDGYELYEELEEDTFTITNEQYSNHMQPNYCMTSHSLQGVSIPESEGEITLLDLFSKNCYGKLFVTRNWLYVSLTRCVCLDNLVICDDAMEYEPKNLKEKIEGHRNYDIVNKLYNKLTFITEQWFHLQINKQQFMCSSCKVPLLLEYESGEGNQYSINRRDNEKGHTIDNSEITCWTCNQRDTFEYRNENKDLL